MLTGSLQVSGDDGSVSFGSLDVGQESSCMWLGDDMNCEEL